MSPRRVSQSNQIETGSPPPGEPVFLAVGRLRRPHGVLGEILMDILTDFPERIRVGATLYVGDSHRPLKVSSLRWANNVMLIFFGGYDTLEAVGELRNQIVYVPVADRPVLPKGEYYHHQLIGKQVVSEDGRILGILSEILETGANDVAVVRPESGSEILLPLIEAVLLGVDEERGEVQVHVLPGIIEE